MFSELCFLFLIFMSIIVIVTLVLIFYSFLTIFRPDFKQPGRKMVFFFLKKRGPAFWESAGVRELNNIILYYI